MRHEGLMKLIDEPSPKRCASLACIGLMLLAVMGFAWQSAAMDPSHPLGFDPERSTQSSAEGIDQIDLFSGGLSLTVPVGPFALLFNSNVWHYSVDDLSRTKARPHYEHTAGIGWHLGWGEVLHPNHDLNETEKWLHVDSMGSQRTFGSPAVFGVTPRPARHRPRTA